MGYFVGNEHELFTHNGFSQPLSLKPSYRDRLHDDEPHGLPFCKFRKAGVQVFVDGKSRPRVSPSEISRQGRWCRGWREDSLLTQHDHSSSVAEYFSMPVGLVGPH